MSNELVALELKTKAFELEQRRASALAKCAFFPQNLRGDVASALIIYDLAERTGASVLEIAQNLYIIKDKPAFSTQYMVGRLNASGLIKSPLKTIISDDKTSAYATAIDSASGEVLKGMTITLDIAKKEGWLGKAGSKWQTMPELMLRYRAQSFFIGEFYPQIKLGVKIKEEVDDMLISESKDESKKRVATTKQDLSAYKPTPQKELFNDEIIDVAPAEPDEAENKKD